MGYKRTGMPNGRPPSPHNRIAKAVVDQDVEELLWAYIDLHSYELRKGDPSTFNANHLVSFVAELIKINNNKSPEDTGSTLELEAFLGGKEKKKKA